MSSSRIEELKRKRELEYKKKKNQRKYGWIILITALVIFIVVFFEHALSGWTWIIGLLIGYTLQRSKFCFTASFRDPVLVGSTSVLRAILVAFMIMTIGFGVLQTIQGGSDPVGLVEPAGANTAVGAILFGIGMVLAGGCASGTLMRIGEGFILQMVVLVGFIIGTLLAAGSFEMLDQLLVQGSKIIYIPDYIGLEAAVGIQLIVLATLYVFLLKYDKKHSIMI